MFKAMTTIRKSVVTLLACGVSGVAISAPIDWVNWTGFEAGFTDGTATGTSGGITVNYTGEVYNIQTQVDGGGTDLNLFSNVATLDGDVQIGGFGSFVLHSLACQGLLDGGLTVRPMTLPDRFLDHDKPDLQYESAGLSSRHVVAEVLTALGVSDRGDLPVRA